MRYARFVNNEVVEVLEDLPGVPISEMFHEGIVKNLMEIGDSEVTVGWILDHDRGGWIAPSESSPVES